MNKVKSIFSNQKGVPFIRRLVAYFIDWYVISVLTLLPINFIYSLTYQQKSFESTIANLPVFQASLAFGIGFMFSILYLVYYPFQHNGQTLGKKLLGLQIIKDNHEPLDFKTLLIRNGLGLIVIEGALFTCSIYFWELMNLLFQASISAYVLTIFSIITIISMAISLLTTHHRMLHDFLAKTSVIMIHK